MWLSHDAANAEGNDTISWNRHFDVPLKILVHSCLTSKSEVGEAKMKLYLPIYVILATSLARSPNVPFELIAPLELVPNIISTMMSITIDRRSLIARTSR